MVPGAKSGVREFLYCHGQAGTVKKFTGVSVYPVGRQRAAQVMDIQPKAQVCERKNRANAFSVVSDT